MGLWDPSRASCKVVAPSPGGWQGLGGDSGGRWDRCMPGGAPAGLGKVPGERGPPGHSSTSLGQMLGLCGEWSRIALLDGSSWVRTSPCHAGRMRPQAPAVSSAMELLAATFSSIAGTRSRLEELQSNSSRRLASLRDSINRTLQRCGRPCRSVSLGGLTFRANFSLVRGAGCAARGPPQPLPQPPHPRLFPADPRCGAAAGGAGQCVRLQHSGRFREGKGSPPHPGTGLCAPGAAL